MSTSTPESASRGLRRKPSRFGAIAASGALVAGLVTAAGMVTTTEPAGATYAEGGSGLYTGAIDWLEWGANGARIENGATATTTREVAGQELTTTCTITGVAGNEVVQAYRSGSYSGDALDDLYNISGTGTSNQMVYGLANGVNGATVNFHFSCETTLNGAPVPLAGLVFADAESSNASQNEYVQATPDEQDATWRVIERYTSCATQVIADRTVGGNAMRLRPNGQQCSNSGGNGPIAIGYMDGATGAQVQLRGGGTSAVALGVVLEADFGDAPASYGEAGALFQRAWNGGEVPNGAATNVFGSFELATPGQPRTRLGALTDADSGHQASARADADDLTNEADEDAISPVGEIAVTPGGSYTLDDVSCTGPGYVAGWIDWNGNGAFDEGERSDAVSCPGGAGGGSVSLEWAVPADAQAQRGDDLSFLRLRIAQTEAGMASPVGLTTSGEVEDHPLDIALPELEIEKISDATENTRPGDIVTYTVRASNPGPAHYTADFPAVVFDDLSGVLDDADYNGDASADRPGDVSYAAPLASWSGALAAGETVELTYTTTAKGGGDGVARNVAWNPADPEDPAPPACDGGATDPATGEPCAVTQHELPRLVVSKTARETELPAVGETAHFRITVTNPGPGDYTEEASARVTDDLSDVLDDATFVSATSDVGAQPVLDGETLTWEGPLAAGETATIDYEVTYTGEGDNVLRNAVCADPEDTAPGAYPCDYAQIPAADLHTWKSVSASSDPVVAGTQLEYTLWFLNDGQAAAAVDHVDSLAQVTDDADVTVEPSSDVLDATRDGDEIRITGSVPAGGTVSVTYTVTVRGDGERGDDVATNFLLPAGEEPPADGVCEPSDERFPECTSTPIAAFSAEKSVSASSDPVVEGTVLTYEITVRGTGSATAEVAIEDVLAGVIDDADITTPPTSDLASVRVSDIEDGRFSITGTIGAGETATITYEATVRAAAERGDHRADNFLVLPGDEPPAECTEGDDCTSTPMAAVSAEKSSDPASGEEVAAGDEITYTLTFRNDGTAPGAVDWTDDLSGVLDDATLSSGPTVSDEALAAILDGEELAVTGELAGGQVVTVEYTVVVGADGERGDSLLGNVLAPTGSGDPSCGDEGVSCTEHPVPQLQAWKTVEASATPVVAGTQLEYTLLFENTGAAPAPVDHVDSLAQVTDDADVTVEPSSDVLDATRDGDEIRITGSVAPGSTETVTYTVTVRADGERGDDVAANFLLPSGEEPPTAPTCEPGDADRPDCTVTPIGALSATKSSDPASGTTLAEGDTVQYTLTFENTGQTPFDVAWTDDLSRVLDDARIVSGPTADGGLTAELDGDQLRVSGALEAGATSTVVYEVEVLAYADQGDHVLDNVLFPAGDEPPAACDADDPLCTTHPTEEPDVDETEASDDESGVDESEAGADETEAGVDEAGADETEAGVDESGANESGESGSDAGESGEGSANESDDEDGGDLTPTGGSIATGVLTVALAGLLAGAGLLAIRRRRGEV
ncbi:CshA/CshB family fibrillar adhesin-related protein [Microbacterium sp. gxy059]|uniref:CshA/CshB family fibrillar adhesin-related protein n=1 Tax=Microbacterium sp. gxy059 TaxID=2957199 RepID=UPI003D9704B0